MEENEFVPCCEAEHHHPELIEHVKKITPNDEILMDLAELYGDFSSAAHFKAGKIGKVPS